MRPLTAEERDELHRRSLNICRGERAICPKGCAKDHGPNCQFYIDTAFCGPSQAARRERE